MGEGCDWRVALSWGFGGTWSEPGGVPWASGRVRRRVVPSKLFVLVEARPTSDELTVLYSNGPDDRSVKLALGYVTAATSGC